MDFEMFAGNTKNLIITVYDLNTSLPVNLTGVTAIKWQLWLQGAVSGTALLSKSLISGITVNDPANGQFTVALSSADTTAFKGEYYYESQVTDVSNNLETVLTGLISIKPRYVT